ncbi:MAG: hypothetical protein ACREUA_10000 [Burkholderiales bacterium]
MQATALLRLYDYPHPDVPDRRIPGYDRAHALRTSRMCAAVALRMGHSTERVTAYQVACLLHDLGRAGLEPGLFGRIWSWAKSEGIPTRPREWRAAYPDTRYGKETEAFIARHGAQLEKLDIVMNAWTREQIEMRLGYARRLMRMLRRVKPRFADLGIEWRPWMLRVVLYYYYPEKLAHAARWQRELAEILVACEQFEAYSNKQRGRDYYVRSRETLREAFAYLEKLQGEGILSRNVINALRELAAAGAFDKLITQARGAALSKRDIRYLRHCAAGVVL